ncbi:MAG: hypothetical protein Q9218_001616 [Villophora microphyllina]
MEEEDKICQRVLGSTLAKVKAISESDNEAIDTCVICLDSISERAAASPCKHKSFDFLCLISWLQERSTCPLCKTEVLAVEYGWHSPQGRRTYKVPQLGNPEQPTIPTVQRLSRTSDLQRRYSWANPRPRRFARPKPLPEPDAALRRRRQVYAKSLYSLHVGSNRLSRFRDLTTERFNQDEELVRRARNWIRRELQVFEFLSIDGGTEEGISRRANNAEFLLEYIIAILKTVDIKGSGGQAEDMVQEFLGRQNTQLFLHELKAWLRSPYISLADWDRHVQYADVASTIPVTTKSQFNDTSNYHGADPLSRRSNTRHSPMTPSDNVTHRTDRRHNPYPSRATARTGRSYHYQPDGG